MLLFSLYHISRNHYHCVRNERYLEKSNPSIEYRKLKVPAVFFYSIQKLLKREYLLNAWKLDSSLMSNAAEFYARLSKPHLFYASISIIFYQSENFAFFLRKFLQIFHRNLEAQLDHTRHPKIRNLATDLGWQSFLPWAFKLCLTQVNLIRN